VNTEIRIYQAVALAVVDREDRAVVFDRISAAARSRQHEALQGVTSRHQLPGGLITDGGVDVVSPTSSAGQLQFITILHPRGHLLRSGRRGVFRRFDLDPTAVPKVLPPLAMRLPGLVQTGLALFGDDAVEFLHPLFRGVGLRA